MSDRPMPKVDLSIDAAHTMPQLERAKKQFEDTIAETLAKVDFIGETISGSILKAVQGTSFRGSAGVSVHSYPEVEKRTMEVVVQPPGLSSGYCILCRLTADESIDLIDLYEKIMAANQPKRYAIYIERKTTDAQPIPDQILDEKPFSWAIGSIPFSPHPETLVDDLENLKIILAEVAQQANQDHGIISTENLINLVLGCCDYNPDHYGEEITAEVIEYFADEILPAWVEQNYFIPVESADGLGDYKLGPAAESLLSEEELPEHDPMIERARRAKLQAQTIVNELTKKIPVEEKKIKELNGKIAALQEELETLKEKYTLDCETLANAKIRFKHASHALELIQRANKELNMTE